ncbi:MAG: cation:H+ antiporter [Polaribacter sp.]|jgi:cation:H+ antiporter
MTTDLLLYVGMFILSLAVLLKASDWFIDSAEEIGRSLGISPFIIGVTIVACGTSLPELATSVASVLAGNSEIVIGNVVGSNITNIALVLGLVAWVSKEIRLDYNIWDIDMPYLWGSAFLLYFVVSDLSVSLFEAFIFLGGVVIFLAYSFDIGDDDKGSEQEKVKASPKAYVMLLVGGVLVWLAADYTIQAISGLSAMAGIKPEIIALTAVALGTSLPEVIVSIGAARKGKTSIAVGNVLGSNIFNTYIVMAVSRFFGPLTIPASILTFSLPMMVAMTILFGMVSNNKKITRWEGVLLLLFYVFFIGETLKSLF